MGDRVKAGDIALCEWTGTDKKRLRHRIEGEVIRINEKRGTLRLKFVRTTLRGRDVTVAVKEITAPLDSVLSFRAKAAGEHTDVRASPFGAALLSGIRVAALLGKGE
jgi:hypothetical protein